jgi:hypothetical protein
LEIAKAYTNLHLDELGFPTIFSSSDNQKAPFLLSLATVAGKEKDRDLRARDNNSYLRKLATGASSSIFLH